jgi:MFS family permease
MLTDLIIKLIGQLSFGYIGDRWGRKKIYGIELIIITIATIFCATSASAEAGLSAIAFLGFWRLILGIGIGGDYPLSATITSEWASSKRRGQMIAAVFSMQGFGNVAAALVTLIVLACFKVPVQNNVVNLDYVWRICVGLGAVPAAATIYFRLTLPESPRYSVDVIGDKEAAQKALEINKWVPADDKEASLHRRDSLVPPNSEKGEQNVEHISEVTNQNGTDIDEAKHSKRDFRAVS